MTGPDLAAIESRIARFIRSEFLEASQARDVENQTDLVKTGLVDSINVLSLVEFLEDEFHIELEPSDVQRLRSISDIAGVVLAKVTP